MSHAQRTLLHCVVAGIPSEQEYIEVYCQARGIAVPDPTTYAFCQALSMFRIAAILAGVGARAQLGNASSKHAAEVCSWPTIVFWAILLLPSSDTTVATSCKDFGNPVMLFGHVVQQQYRSVSRH